MARYLWLAAPCIRTKHPFSLTTSMFSSTIKQNKEKQIQNLTTKARHSHGFPCSKMVLEILASKTNVSVDLCVLRRRLVFAPKQSLMTQILKVPCEAPDWLLFTRQNFQPIRDTAWIFTKWRHQYGFILGTGKPKLTMRVCIDLKFSKLRACADFKVIKYLLCPLKSFNKVSNLPWCPFWS